MNITNPMVAQITNNSDCHVIIRGSS